MPDFPLVHVSRPPAEPAEPAERAPAVVLLHGRGGDEYNMIGLADNLPDDLHAFGVRAPYEVGSGSGYAWFPESPRSRGGFRKAVDRLAAFVRGVPEAYNVDPQRVGLFGFSQGAIAALAALVDYPDRLRWAAAMNGYLPESHDDPEEVADARGKAVFVAVGEDDTVIPPRYGEASAELLAEAGLDVTFRAYPTGHRMIPREIRDLSAWLDSRR
ncbi:MULTISPECIES: alpha/beta hydrolase [Halorussus]|uniref:alpha/beta hydrolase n=1 Tax=Halorussus TaxID=1070314 RepID=UPI00209DDCB9|nr:alpha/beta fold hydrolase [Halorussus vallis]USZ77448.1 dienelactone hydrolase family protein [Halorussus vallis]